MFGRGTCICYYARMVRSIFLSLIAIVLFVTAPVGLFSQTPAATPNGPAGNSTLAQLAALRDDFIAQIKAEGFQPSLAAPAIVLDNPQAYGRYDDEKNVLHMSEWSTLAAEQQARFSHLAQVLGGEKTGEQMFDESIHHWVFIHEMSHWWQACQHKTGVDRYSVEYGANRIAAAYWRMRDPALMKRTAERMYMVSGALPDPVPEGQSKEKYFNENFTKLAPTPGYIWFQYSMVIDAQGEKPLPSFKQALQQPFFP